MSVTLPPENLDQGVVLFGDVVTHPIFADIEVERGIIREEILEDLDEDGKSVDPDNLARALIYPSHPLGMSITGSLASVDAIDEAGLRAHHAEFYTGTNAVLCFAGPIEVERCVDLAARHFSGLPRGNVPTTSPPPVQHQPRFQYTDSQGSQTDLRLAFRAPGLNDPDEAATELIVRLLDDGNSTRLYAKICDEKGLCYDVSAEYEPFADDGVLDLAAAVRHERAPLVMRELAAIVSALVREGPTEEELRICKNRHGWELHALLDHAEGLADYHGVAQLQQHGDTLLARKHRIEAVSRDQIVHTARRIFAPEHVSAVAVGMLRRNQRKELEQIVNSFRAG